MLQATLPREYRHGRRGSVLVWIAVGGAVVLMSVKLLDPEVPDALRISGLGLVLVLGAVALVARRNQFTRVDRDGITRRNGFGTRRLAWRDLHDVRTWAAPRNDGPGPSTVTYAYLADGRRLLLPCVDDVELPDVEREAAALRSLLVELRGADWAPDPRAEQRIARQTARYDGFYRWMSGWRLFVSVGAFIVVALAGILGYAILFGPA